jgi:hypothetical protein
MPASRRTATKLLRLYPEELAHITARAHAYGLTPARFIREAALGPRPKTWHHREADRIIRALARIGRSLEHVARLTRPGLNTAVAKHLADLRAEYHALVRQLMQNGGQGSRRSSQ